MNRLRRWWESLFEPRSTRGYELLLALLLYKAIKDGCVSLFQSAESFRDSDAFAVQSLGIEPVGWATWLPADVVLSPVFDRCLGAVVAISGLLWLCKRALPVAPVVCALGFGLLESLSLSRMFNYKHQQLITAAALTVYAVFYVLRHPSIRAALRERRFWSGTLYADWVRVVIIAFLGFQYSYSGVTKLAMAGFHSGSGIKLQLLIYDINSTFGELRPVGPAARMILENRWLADISMTVAVILETGAILAFASRRLRPVWALGLLVMHLLVIFSMSIPFVPNMVVLTWMLVCPETWSAIIARLEAGLRSFFPKTSRVTETVAQHP